MEMLATTLNVEFSPIPRGTKKRRFIASPTKIARTTNITQSGVGDKRGLGIYGDRLGDSDL